jgi:hypothetical protein
MRSDKSGSQPQALQEIEISVWRQLVQAGIGVANFSQHFAFRVANGANVESTRFLGVCTAQASRRALVSHCDALQCPPAFGNDTRTSLHLHQGRDMHRRTATTPVFASGSASQPIETIAGAGTIYGSRGGVIAQCTDDSTPAKSIACRFGDFSSVAVDPTVSGCAFATQQYFATDKSWKSRIAPIGQCESVVIANPR